jgi:N-acetylglutamate synthase-like GNAT family acetyltransferase
MDEIRFRKTRFTDIPQVQALLRSSPDAVLPVSERELSAWIVKGFSMVGVFTHSRDGAEKVVAHQAVDVWPESGWAEFRSALVHEAYRGLNINFNMKNMMLEMLRSEHPEIPTVAVLKNGVSNGVGILTELGFAKAEQGQVPAEFFSIGVGQDWKVYIKELRK